MLDWAEVDDKLTTPAFFATGKHHDLFREMRAAEPIHWTVGKSPRPYWSLTRYADCVRVLEDAATFSSEHGGIMLPTAEYPSPEQRHAMGYGSIPTHTDPPRHLMLRQPFNKYWSAPAIARMRDKVAGCVDAILAEVGPRGECDLVEDLAAQLPARLVCELMGVPGTRPDTADLFRDTYTAMTRKKRPLPPAGALREAKLLAIKRARDQGARANALMWGAFVQLQVRD